MLKKASVLFLSLALLLCLAPVVQADFSTPAVNLSNSPTTSSLYPKMASINGTNYAFVVWIETDGTNDTIYFSRSTNGGSTWSSAQALTNSSGQIQDPREGYDEGINDYTFAFWVDNPYIHLVIQWRQDDSDDFDIWYLRSDDLGATWNTGAWVALTTNTTDSHFPDVAARGGYVHVVYTDNWPGNEELFYKRITSNGAGGQDQNRRLTYSSGITCYPRVAVSLSGMTVNVAYEDYEGPTYQIFFKHIYDYGAGTFQTYKLTSGSYWNGLPDTVFSTAPAPDDDYFYIVYNTTYPGQRDIMYKRIDLWGQAGFSTYTARLTYSTTDSRSNSIDFDNINNTIHISYDDDWPGNYDVMYRKLTNFGGAGFSGQRVSWGTGVSSHSGIAASGNSAYIVWSDDSSGNYEIYVKKGS